MATSTPQQTTQRGWWPRLRARVFGERDAIAEQLADLARQGSGMAHLAHLCAFLLIILFSAGSLVALSADALNGVLVQWQSGGGVNIPDVINVAVSTLLVFAMDIGMLYAASQLRVLATRRAPAADRRLHQLVMATVAVLEASTYAYMSATYDHPANIVAWAIILGRSASAPFLAVYLSMARVLPVTSRDILAEAEIATGRGVLYDVTRIANDEGAPLARKLRLYQASAYMSPQDSLHLQAMIAVALEDNTPDNGITNVTPFPATPTTTDGALALTILPAVERPVEGMEGGTVHPIEPIDRRGSWAAERAADAAVITLHTAHEDDATPDAMRDQSGVAYPTTEPPRSERREERSRAKARKAAAPKAVKPLPNPTGGSLEEQARMAWAQGHRTISTMQKATGMYRTTAQAWVRQFKAEQRAGGTVPPAWQAIPGQSFYGAVGEDPGFDLTADNAADSED